MHKTLNTHKTLNPTKTPNVELQSAPRSPSCPSPSSTDVVPRGACRAEQSGAVHALKLYPAGATTNSDAGVTNLLGKCLPALKAMVELGLPLLVRHKAGGALWISIDRRVGIRVLERGGCGV